LIFVTDILFKTLVIRSYQLGIFYLLVQMLDLIGVTQS